MKDIIAFFPGQGAQQVGMLQDLVADHPIIKETFEQASEAINQDLWQLSQEGPAEELNLTYNTQPALLTASMALWRVVQAQAEINVKAAAGHSLGEYSALVAAGALTLEEGVKLVKQRGTLMDNAVPAGQGGMAAVLGLDGDQIQQVCADAKEVGLVEPANFNAPGQIVIAGTASGVEKACELAKAAGAKRALPLAVSGPFHSSLMKEAAEPFIEALQQVNWQAPAFPVLHNATNTLADLADIPQRLVEQLYSPVNWIGAVEAATQAAAKVECAVEFGPGKVLAGLNKRIDKSLATLNTGDAASLEKALSGLAE